MKKILALLLAVLTLFCLCSCGGEEPEPTPPDTDPGHSVVQDAEAHYVVFLLEGKVELERMLVVSTDTFENLEPYFPTIPEKAGYNSYWEETVVYAETQKEVYINAYYVKKQ